MALVRNTVDVVQIPHEPGNSAVIHRLRPSILRQAAELRSERGIEKIRSIGADFMLELQKLGDKAVKQEPKAGDQYDEETLVLHGVEFLDGPLYDGRTAMTDDVAKDLDESTLTFLAEKVLTFAKTGAAEKNA